MSPKDPEKPLHEDTKDKIVLREGIVSPDDDELDYGDYLDNGYNDPGLSVAAEQVRPDYPPSVADELFKILERELDVVATIKTGKVVRRS